MRRRVHPTLTVALGAGSATLSSSVIVRVSYSSIEIVRSSEPRTVAMVSDVPAWSATAFERTPWARHGPMKPSTSVDVAPSSFDSARVSFRIASTLSSPLAAQSTVTASFPSLR